MKSDQQTTPPVENSRRIIPIFANLMPMEVVEVRHGRQARRTVLASLAVLFVVVGGLYAVAVLQKRSVATELAQTQDRAQRLQQQQRQFNEVVRVQEETRQAKKQLTDLMVDDLRWSAVLSSLRTAAPAGIQLTAVTSTLTAKQAAEAAAAAAATDTALPSTSESKPVGTVTITGEGPSKPVIASYVDALGKLPGVADPYLGGVTEAEDGLQFSLRLTITAEALGGRFAAPDSTAGGN